MKYTKQQMQTDLRKVRKKGFFVLFLVIFFTWFGKCHQSEFKVNRINDLVGWFWQAPNDSSHNSVLIVTPDDANDENPGATGYRIWMYPPENPMDIEAYHIKYRGPAMCIVDSKISLKKIQSLAKLLPEGGHLHLILKDTLKELPEMHYIGLTQQSWPQQGQSYKLPVGIESKAILSGEIAGPDLYIQSAGQHLSFSHGSPAFPSDTLPTIQGFLKPLDSISAKVWFRLSQEVPMVVYSGAQAPQGNDSTRIKMFRPHTAFSFRSDPEDKTMVSKILHLRK